MITVIHPTGNAFVRAVLVALEARGLLEQFETTLAFNSRSKWLQLAPARLREELLRRSYPEIPAARIRRHPAREFARFATERIGWKSPTRHETGWASLDAVYRSLDAAAAKRVASVVPQAQNRGPHSSRRRGVFAYEDGALETLTVAGQLGLLRCYDLPIAYWETTRRLLDEEARRYPEWRFTLPSSIDSPGKLDRKRRELEQADLIFCPSPFVAASLPASARARSQVVVSAFGSPPAAPLRADRIRSDRPFRLLFAGSLGQRKGLADLFAAMRLLPRGQVELVVMGTPAGPLSFYRRQYPEFTFEPSRPHAEVLQLMRTCDALILPSIVEGRALVLQEAMSQGLPLILTPNSGGEDLVAGGDTGFLVPIRSPAALAEKITWLAEHRAAADEMGRAAQRRAAQFTWDGYGRAIVEAIERAL